MSLFSRKRQAALQRPDLRNFSYATPYRVSCSYMIDLGFVATGVVLVIALYVVIYMPYIARVDIDSRVYAPKLVPAATIAGLLALLWCAILIAGKYPPVRILGVLMMPAYCGATICENITVLKLPAPRGRSLALKCSTPLHFLHLSAPRDHTVTFSPSFLRFAAFASECGRSTVC